MSSFWQFFDSQTAFFRRVSFEKSGEKVTNKVLRCLGPGVVFPHCLAVVVSPLCSKDVVSLGRRAAPEGLQSLSARPWGGRATGL